MNELLWIITLIISFAGLLLFYRFFGKTGLYLWLALAVIVANIQTVKLVNLFGLETTLGNILYGSTFLVTDILSEKYGKKEARKTIIYGMAIMIFMTLLMYISLLFKPSPSDFVTDSLNTIFTLNVRVTLASIVAFLISQFIDTFLYQKLKERYNKIYISNNVSTIVSQFFDCIIFNGLAFLGLVKITTLFQIILSTFILKVIVALCDTPFMYLAMKINSKEDF